MAELNNEVKHPGLLLQEKIIDGKNLTQKDAAELLGISKTQLNYIIKGKYGLSLEMCQRLEIVFGEDSLEWAFLQTKYDMQLAKDKILKLGLKPSSC